MGDLHFEKNQKVIENIEPSINRLTKDSYADT